MATTAELERLDAAHRAQQVANTDALARFIVAYWATVKAENLSATGAEWLRRVLPAVYAAFRNSARLANGYAVGVRRVQAPGAPPLRLPALPVPNTEAITKALTYTAMVAPAMRAAKEAALAQPVQTQRPVPSPALMEAARDASVATAVRHATNGARYTVDNVVAADRLAIGYIRVTREDPCYFCAMLASRGAVYKSDSFEASNARFTGPGDHKAHDSCHCMLRPVYTPSSAEWPSNTMRFKELWAATGDPLSFRQAYEGRAKSV